MAVGSFGNAMNLAIFENLSTTVRTVVFPWEAGSPVTKSSEMVDQGLDGMGRGCRRLMQGPVETLFLAQTEQASTYSRTSDSIEGHQKLREIANMVRRTPR